MRVCVYLDTVHKEHRGQKNLEFRDTLSNVMCNTSVCQENESGEVKNQTDFFLSRRYDMVGQGCSEEYTMEHKLVHSL